MFTSYVIEEKAERRMFGSEMHTRHSEALYLDYQVVALCVLIVLARIVGAPPVYFSGSARVFSIWLKLSVLALAAILTEPGKK